MSKEEYIRGAMDLGWDKTEDIGTAATIYALADAAGLKDIIRDVAGRKFR